MPEKKKNTVFLLITTFAIILTLAGLVLKVVVIASPKEKPIVPASSSQQTTKNSTTATSSTKQKTTKSKDKKDTKKTKNNNKSKKSKKDNKKKDNTKKKSKQDKKAKAADKDVTTINLVAKKDAKENYEGESVVTYLVNQPIEKEGFICIVNSVAIGKLDPKNMKSLNFSGEGLVDVNLTLENKTDKEVTIYPSKTSMTISGKEHKPLDTVLKDGPIKPNDSVDGSISIAMDKLKSTDDVKEVSFQWKTTSNKVDKLYNVKIDLK